MQAALRLIKKISSRPSTEALILFIAENDEMTDACTALRKKINRNNKREIKELDLICRSHHLSLDLLSREIEHVLSIFAPKKNISDEYTTLGLEADADHNQVKQAFRKLSIKHHPDTSKSGNSDKFIAISKAYQSLIKRTAATDTATVSPAASWHYRKKKPARRTPKKKYIYLFSIAAGSIFLLILISSLFYQKQAMLNNLNQLNPVLTKQSIPAKKQSSTEDNKMSPAKPAQNHAPLPALSDLQRKKIKPEQTSNDIKEIETDRTESQALSVISAIPTTIQSELAAAATTDTPGKEAEQRSFTGATSYNGSTYLDDPALQNSLTETQLQSDTITNGQEAATPSVQEKNIKEKATSSNIAQPATSSSEHSSNDLFSSAKYQKTVVKSLKRKIRKKKISQEDATLNTPVIPSITSLRNFLKKYTAAYTSKDIQLFASFFTDDATENGKPFIGMRKKYSELFNAVDEIDYDINIMATTMQGDNINIKGRFKVLLMYPQSKLTYSRGSITFLLTNKNQQYRVKELTYRLDPKK
jgi:hypothetical protein